MTAQTLNTGPPGETGELDSSPGLPRLLAGVDGKGPMALEQHLAVHGMLPAAERRQARLRRRHAEHPLIEQIGRAGLGGRGGAGFPTARKLRAVLESRGRAIVVVNAAEGEPASRKDRMLLQTLPHLVLDGAELAAEAVAAEELIIAVCESAPACLESVGRGIEERRELLASQTPIQVRAVPGDYVAGQESALVNHLNGGPATPTFTPPLPSQQGVGRRPTLVHNPETLAHLALIARHGAGWFRQLGTASQTGSALVTLSGPVTRPGVYEIEYGASLSSLIDAAAGTSAPARALLVGGYGGSWIGGELLGGIRLSDEHLACHSAGFGAGVVLLLSEDACPVAETARTARWLADQSSRQCGPCMHGLDVLATTVAEIARGDGHARAGERISQLAALVRGRGACRHPDGAANFVASAIETFAPEFSDHARRGPCDACARPAELPLPRAAGAPAANGRRPIYRARRR
jgi:NADH:ubiquinone oxidoreductase subunit F (NADH-binding)